MAKTRSMTRNQDYDASSTKRIKNSEDVGVVPWADLNCDVLYLVMVRLGVFDLPAFSRVCKSWRSVALSNRNRFMTSRPPMSISFSTTDVNEKECCLEDFDGRKFKTIIPHSDSRTCVGLTCGYLIFFGRERRDFWLVNPITSHQLHFPNAPFHVNIDSTFLGVRAILVFLPSIHGWVLVVTHGNTRIIWYSIEGEGAWNHVSSPFFVCNFHAFKGKIYTLNYREKTRDNFQLCEMRLNPHPKLTLLETKNIPKSYFRLGFKSSGGNLCVIHLNLFDWFRFHELDFGEMKWVFREETREEYALFSSLNHLQQTCVFKLESWTKPWFEYGEYVGTKNSWKDRFYTANMWYFPHDCLKVNCIHE